MAGLYSFLPGTGTGCILLGGKTLQNALRSVRCQCPLGLIPHFYFEKMVEISARQSRVNALSGLYLISTQWGRFKSNHILPCQCPLGLIPHFYAKKFSQPIVRLWGVNALSGLYLISTVPLQKPRFYAVSRACFYRYLSEYSDNSRFSCMLTIWTYLMRCTYPWHWI